MTEIVKAPNNVLSQKAKPVKKVDGQILKIIGQMKKALLAAKDPVGVGLAAPQIGKLLQIFLAKPNANSKIHVFINPKVELLGKPVSKKKGKEIKLEGCLSLPNIWGELKRPSSLSITYLDEKRIKNTKKVSGFLATIILHEMDHLSGILFPKRVLEQKGTLYRSEKDEKGEDVFEEIKI
ncbi:MAG: peptide deformylase [Candidatus Levybacteria bacterium RBG_16_35_11]|nr:MAG: peptide deformylase [Candidatus Levybacteria bacterium RBG_16_35_11]